MLSFFTSIENIKNISKWLLTELLVFNKNNTGWVGVIFSSERGKYRLNYKDSQNKSRVKDFKTLEEALLYQKCVLKLDNQKTLKSRSNSSG